jgi:proline dehydrogenase
MGIARHTLLWASRQAWIGEQFRKRSFAKRATSRFIPGESIESALKATASFSQDGITSLVSNLGENVTTAAEVESVTEHYLDVLGRIGQLQLPCHISLKPTHLGLDLGADLCSEHLSTLLVKATESGSFIWIDMESSAYVDRTLDLFEKARNAHENVGICIQSCLYRSADDLERLIARKSAVRLVKGAYSEPADVGMKRKKDVDSNFLVLGNRMLDAVAGGSGGLPVFGTHDMRILDLLIERAAAKEVDKRAFEIQMLYGIAREQQHRLAAAGHEMRVLICYGEAWFPWYMRRLAERPANVWFVLRSVFKA